LKGGKWGGKKKKRGKNEDAGSLPTGSKKETSIPRGGRRSRGGGRTRAFFAKKKGEKKGLVKAQNWL